MYLSPALIRINTVYSYTYMCKLQYLITSYITIVMAVAILYHKVSFIVVLTNKKYCISFIQANYDMVAMFQ